MQKLPGISVKKLDSTQIPNVTDPSLFMENYKSQKILGFDTLAVFFLPACLGLSSPSVDHRRSVKTVSRCKWVVTFPENMGSQHLKFALCRYVCCINVGMKCSVLAGCAYLIFQWLISHYLWLCVSPCLKFLQCVCVSRYGGCLCLLIWGLRCIHHMQYISGCLHTLSFYLKGPIHISKHSPCRKHQSVCSQTAFCRLEAPQILMAQSVHPHLAIQAVN